MSSRVWKFLRDHGVLVFSGLICLVLAGTRLHAVSEQSGFVGHRDERHIYKQARTILEGPDLNPHFFRYPSAPIYLTSASLWLSNQVARDFKERRGHFFEVPVNVGEPYFPERPFRHSRLLFGLLGASTFFSAAMLARALSRTDKVGWIAALLLGTCPILQYLIVGYQNVDTPTIAFALLTVTCVATWWEHDCWIRKVVAPGFLCGLTTACKYNSGLIILPCALAIFLAPQVQMRVAKATALSAIAAATFFTWVPYSLLDFPQFWADVLFEVEHYRNGVAGNKFQESPGLPQLVHYFGELAEQYGVPACAAATLGVGYAVHVKPRLALAVLSFPLLMLVHMSTNRVNYLRTIGPVIALLPVFSAVGVAGLARGARAFLSSRACYSLGRYLPGRRYEAAVSVAIGCVAVSSFSFTAHAEHLFDRDREADSRKLAARFVENRARASDQVAIADDLWFAPDASPDRNMFRLRSGLPAPSSLQIPDHVEFFILPHFAPTKTSSKKARKEARRAVEEANQRRSELVARLGLQPIATFGKKVLELSSPGHKPLPTQSPRLTIYRRHRPD